MIIVLYSILKGDIMEEFIKKRWDNFLKMGVPGFDLAVYKDGECIVRYANGYSDLENKIPISGNERYYIYSCSKPITCVAAMQLWEKGLFSLDDKLSDYMPEFRDMNVLTENGIKKAENPILIEHLFTMRAGFDYNVYSPSMQKGIEETNGRCPTREMMKYLAQEPLLFEPGERYEYSLCHDVLAALVEVISGEKFETYVKKNIFDVLGMNDSTYIITEKEKETVIPLYRFDEETKKAINENKVNWYTPGPEYASGGAGCISTVDDYMKFLEAIRKGDIILKKETIKLMSTPRYTNEEEIDWINYPYGYGLGLRAPLEKGIHKDFGWGGAAGAFLAVDIENGISIFHVQHMLCSPNQEMRGRIYNYLMAYVFGREDFKEFVSKETFVENYDLTY